MDALDLVLIVVCIGFAFSGYSQGFLIGVSAVDLDAILVLLAQNLREDHGQSVGFLARGTTCTPYPEGLVCGLAGNELGEDLFNQIVPRLGVAKEGGDVDEEGVEEQGKLFGVYLQVVLVLAKTLYAYFLHALAHPAYQAGRLIASKVEAAAPLDEF